MKSLALCVTIALCICAAIAQDTALVWTFSGPNGAAVTYAGIWNEIYFELPNGPETSEITLNINLVANQLPTTYFSVRPTSSPDPATATSFQFTIDAGEDHTSIFYYTYRARDDDVYPGNAYPSNDNYVLTGPVNNNVPSLLGLNAQLRQWSYTLIEQGKALVSGASITGRVGDSLVAEFNLVDTNTTFPAGNQPIPVLLYSPDSSEYDVFNAITPLTPVLPALVDSHNFTLTVADPGFFNSPTGPGMFLVQPAWLYDTVGPQFTVNVIGGRDLVNAVNSDYDGAVGSSDIQLYVGDQIAVRLGLGDDLGEVPFSGARFRVEPSDPNGGWNILFPAGGPTFVIPSTAFTGAANDSFYFLINTTLPTGQTYSYDIIFDSPAGFAPVENAFTVTVLQKQTSPQYPSSAIPTVIVEFKLTSADDRVAVNPLPGESFAISLHPNSVLPLASTSITWTLVIVPTIQSQNNQSAYTIGGTGQVTQAAYSNAVVSSVLTGTFLAQDVYQVCVLPSTAEYQSWCTSVDVRAGCSLNGNSFGVSPDPTATPAFFTVSFNAFAADELPITVSIDSDDLAAVGPYLTFLNQSITFQPGTPLASNRFYYQHVAWPPVSAGSAVQCVRVQSSFAPPGFLTGAQCGTVCFNWPTYSATLSFNGPTQQPIHVGDTRTLTLAHTATQPYLPDVTYDIAVTNSAWSMITPGPLTLSPTAPSTQVEFRFNGWPATAGLCAAAGAATGVSVLVSPTTTIPVGTPITNNQALLGAFDAPPLTVLMPLANAVVSAVTCGTPIAPGINGASYLMAGEVLPFWVRLDTDSALLRTSTGPYTVSIAPVQPDRSVNIGTWSTTSFVVDMGDDWAMQNFTFTATTPGTASFIITTSPADYRPFLLKIRVAPAVESWTFALSLTSSLTLGDQAIGSLTFSSTNRREGSESINANQWLPRYDNDKRFRIETYGTGNITLMYPPLSDDGWFTVKHGSRRQDLAFACVSPGTVFLHLTTDEVFPVCMTVQRFQLITCTDTRLIMVPSSLPLVERGQDVEFTVAVATLSPKTGRNESLTLALLSGSEEDLDHLAEIRLSERQLILNQNEFYKTFTVKNQQEGLVRLTASSVAADGVSASVSYAVGRASADHEWALYTPSTASTNELFYVELCPPTDYYNEVGVAVDPIEIPIAFNFTFAGDAAASASLPTSNFEDATPNPQYWTSWRSGCVDYYVQASRAGTLEIGVDFLNYTLGVGKKARNYQQTNPLPVTIIITEPTIFWDSTAGSAPQNPSLRQPGDYVEYFVWQHEPETAEADGGYTLLPVEVLSRFGGAVAVTAINVRTGATIADVLATGIRFTATDNQYVVRITEVSPGLVTLYWTTSTRGYEPVVATQRFSLGALDTTGLGVAAGNNLIIPSWSDLATLLTSVDPTAGDSVFSTQITLNARAPVDITYTISIPAPSLSIASFSPSIVTIPAGASSVLVVVTISGPGAFFVNLQPDAIGSDYAAPLVASFSVGGLVSISNWQRFMRDDRIYSLTLARSTSGIANRLLDQPLAVQVSSLETTGDKKTGDNIVWGFQLVDAALEPIADNIVTFPAGVTSLPLLAIVNSSTPEVTIVRAEPVAGASSGFVGRHEYLLDSYPLVNKKVLTLLRDPYISKNGTAELVWFHCPSESVGTETFYLYPHGNMRVSPTSFQCGGSTGTARVWFWGEANRVDIVSANQRAAYDPRDDLNDMAILQLSVIGENNFYK